jgi:hypothetical protein
VRRFSTSFRSVLLSIRTREAAFALSLGLGFCFPLFREGHPPESEDRRAQGRGLERDTWVDPSRGEASLARFEAQAAGKFGSMSRTDLEGIVDMDNGFFVAVIFGRRHYAELAVILKQRHRRHQHLGKIKCVVLS